MIVAMSDADREALTYSVRAKQLNDKFLTSAHQLCVRSATAAVNIIVCATMNDGGVTSPAEKSKALHVDPRVGENLMSGVEEENPCKLSSLRNPIESLGGSFAFLEYLNVVFIRHLRCGRPWNMLLKKIRGLQVALANGLRAYENTEHQTQREPWARHNSVEDLLGSASLVRACLSKFATVQLLRIQHNREFLEYRSSPDKGVQKVAELPTPSIELCCWIFQLLAEEGRVMFSNGSSSHQQCYMVSWWRETTVLVALYLLFYDA